MELCWWLRGDLRKKRKARDFQCPTKAFNFPLHLKLQQRRCEPDRPAAARGGEKGQFITRLELRADAKMVLVNNTMAAVTDSSICIISKVTPSLLASSPQKSRSCVQRRFFFKHKWTICLFMEAPWRMEHFFLIFLTRLMSVAQPWCYLTQTLIKIMYHLQFFQEETVNAHASLHLTPPSLVLLRVPLWVSDCHSCCTNKVQLNFCWCELMWVAHFNAFFFFFLEVPVGLVFSAVFLALRPTVSHMRACTLSGRGLRKLTDLECNREVEAEFNLRENRSGR